jgi:hypothetical protein
MRRPWIEFAVLVSVVLVISGPSVEAQERSGDPVDFVRKFYDVYPDKLSGGLPAGEELDWISAFITDRLYDRFRETLEYQQDWIKRNPDDPPYYLKPPFADGVHFTGVPDAIESFRVLDAELQTPGTWHVRVRFWIDLDSDGWDALVVVRAQRSGYAIDDVIFLPTELGETEWCIFDSLDWRKSE